jgi:hypothetical protein
MRASIAVLICLPFTIHAQGNPPAARALAPIDLTGYWVSIVTEDWRFRMVTPVKGDYASVPLNPEGRRIADTWDPAKDEAAGNQCRSYGAPAIMRVPGRLHITWTGDNTLKIDTDAGTQTRLFHFGQSTAPAGDPSLQGFSVASWEGLVAGRGGAPAPLVGGQARGYLKVVTSQLRPGYLRKNGVPYSASTKLTEFYDHTAEPNGDQWLVVQTIVEDPAYLVQPFITSTHFKKIADASGWSPSSCQAR